MTPSKEHFRALTRCSGAARPSAHRIVTVEYNRSHIRFSSQPNQAIRFVQRHCHFGKFAKADIGRIFNGLLIIDLILR